MKLTKEKCDKALEYARSHYYPPYAETMGLYEDFEVTEEYQVLEQLIKEHFDNPPLKFEEIEAGMWLWDNEEEMYFKVSKVLSFEKMNVEYHFEIILEFEEGRFFRKQVE